MRRNDFPFAAILALAFSLQISCAKKSDSEDSPPLPPASSDGTAADYADSASWLCLPGRDDVCSTPLSTNELLADGTFGAFDPNPNPDDSVDCFYVHPTSDLSVKAGNSENFEYLEPVEELATMQAAPFRSTCRIFAPLYRQVTIGTYALPEAERQPYLDIAAADVQKAFEHYMAQHNQGRKIVFIGHSQGSEMISVLMKARFDGDPAMRAKLLLAILPGFGLHAPIGKAVGGTFANIPACTTAGEVGCVIGFRSYEKGTAYLGDGSISLLEQEEEICVNPGTLDIASLSVEARRTEEVPLGASLFPPSAWVSDSIRDVASPAPFVWTRTTYKAACSSGPDPRNRFLAIAENLPETDPRYGIVLMDSEALSGLTGLHTLDMQFPMADLVGLVRARR